MSAEQIRLDESREKKAAWKKWGPYLSERQWGTVREDYSEGGDAWSYFTHDHARSRAYRWGEDGLAGTSDEHQRLCFALALWNGKDAILSHQTGWTGSIARLMHFFATVTPEQLLQGGKMAYFDSTIESAGGRGPAATVPARGK